MKKYILGLLCCWGCWVAPPLLAVELPDIGNPADTVLSPAEEREVAAQFLRQARKQLDLIDDPEVMAYLAQLGYQLAAHSDNPTLPYFFFAINDSSINAFAVPGGFLGINSGLILHCQEESELASVVAHELAHVTQRHGARGVGEMQQWSIPMLVGMVAAALLVSQDSDAGMAAMAGIQAGAVQMQLNTSRRYEKEADRVGMQILADAGFDPRSMPNFFLRLQEQSRYFGESGLEFLRTHPLTTDRVAESLDRAENYPPVRRESSMMFQLMRAKLLVLTHDAPQQLLKQLSDDLAKGNYRNQAALRYALVQAKLAARDPQGVMEQLAWLRREDADRELYRRAELRLARLQENPRRALEIARQGLKLYPRDPILTELYAQTLLEQERLEQARDVLLALPKQNRPAYYQMLAKVQDKLNDPAAYLAQAQYYYLRGETALAIEQLKQAQKRANIDTYLLAKVNARLRELQNELTEETRKDSGEESEKSHKKDKSDEQ